MIWLHILICYSLNPIVIALCLYLPRKEGQQKSEARLFTHEILLCLSALILYTLWLLLNAGVTWALGKTFQFTEFMGVQYGAMFYFPYTFSAIFLSYHVLIKDALYTKPNFMQAIDSLMTLGFLLSGYILMNYYLAWVYTVFYT